MTNYVQFAIAICMQTATHFEVWASSSFMIDLYHNYIMSTANCNSQSANCISKTAICNCDICKWQINQSAICSSQMTNYMQFAAAICMQTATHFEGWAFSSPPHSSLYISETCSESQFAVFKWRTTCNLRLQFACKLQRILKFGLWAILLIHDRPIS